MWPRVLVTGLVLTVVGVTLLSDTAQALVTLGRAVVFFAATQGLVGKSWDWDRWREPGCRLAAAGCPSVADPSWPVNSVRLGLAAVGMRVEVRVASPEPAAPAAAGARRAHARPCCPYLV